MTSKHPEQIELANAKNAVPKHRDKVEGLPSSAIIISKLETSVEVISALNKIVKAIEDTVQVELTKERLEEIKAFQIQSVYSSNQ